MRRGLKAYYLVTGDRDGGGTTLLVVLLAPWRPSWGWDGGGAPLRVLSGLLTLVSVGVGTWACFEMGWTRLPFAGALFRLGAGAVENLVPRRLVVEEPYRYVRKPLYVTDFA